MTELHQRMMDAMVPRGFSQSTQETYVQAIRRMAKHYRRDPVITYRGANVRLISVRRARTEEVALYES